MTNPIEKSPQFYARFAGILYLIVIAGGIFAEVFVLENMIVNNDPGRTAANILANDLLYRQGFAVHLVVLFSALVIMSIFYFLLRSVNPYLAMVAASFDLVSIAVESVSLLGHYAPLIFLKHSHTASALNTDQWKNLVNIPLAFQSVGYDIALAFFGFFCIMTGLLIFKSVFLPHLLGVLMIIAGCCYTINSFVNFLAPQSSLFPYILLPCFIGELSLCLWLIIKGINVKLWTKSATVS